MIKNMEKGRFKKFLIGVAVVLASVLIAITYFFVLNNSDIVFSLIGGVVGILMPFIIGAIIAYLLKHLCNLFEKVLLKIFSKARERNPRKVERIINPIAIIISYLVTIVAIGTLLFVAGREVYSSILSFIGNLPIYINNILDFVNKVIASSDFIKDAVGSEVIEKLNFLREVSNEEKLAEAGKLISEVANNPKISELITNLTSGNEGASDMIGTIFSGTSNFIGYIIDFGIGVVISFFLLLNRKAISAKSIMLLHVIFKKENIVNAIVEEARFADKTFGGYIEGKIIGSTIVGLVYYLFLTLVGIPNAPLIAVLCGVTNIIPIFGPFIGSIPSGFIILVSNPNYGFIHLIIFVIFVCVYQFIDGYIIDPNIVGGNIKLAPVWVIFAVIFFGGLWGFPGLLIGVPLFAVLYDIVGKICAYMLKKNGQHHLLIEFKQKFGESEGKNKKKKKNKKAAVAANVPTEDVTVSDSDNQNG